MSLLLCHVSVRRDRLSHNSELPVNVNQHGSEQRGDSPASANNSISQGDIGTEPPEILNRGSHGKPLNISQVITLNLSMHLSETEIPSEGIKLSSTVNQHLPKTHHSFPSRLSSGGSTSNPGSLATVSQDRLPAAGLRHVQSAGPPTLQHTAHLDFDVLTTTAVQSSVNSHTAVVMGVQLPLVHQHISHNSSSNRHQQQCLQIL